MTRMLRWAGRSLLILLLPVALYAAAAWLGGLVSVNGDYHAASQGIPVYLHSNGAHIDLVFPVNDCHCGAGLAPALAILDRSFDDTLPREQWQWVAAGWGDEQFMLHVPTWNELTPGIALRAMSGLDGSVLRLSSFREPAPGPSTRRLLLTREQYRALLQYVRRSVSQPLQEKGSSIAGPEDRFYGAQGSYNLFNTCNEWVRQGLVQAGIRAPLWTPFDGALLKGAG